MGTCWMRGQSRHSSGFQGEEAVKSNWTNTNLADLKLLLKVRPSGSGYGNNYGV